MSGTLVAWAAGAGGLALLLAGALALLRGRRRAPAAEPTVPPDRRVVELERARIARRGTARDVVAAVAPPGDGSVYEVVWRFDGERGGFVLATLDGDALELPRSRPTPWRIAGAPPAVPSLVAAHEEFCAALLGAGWRPAGQGEAWFGRRFRVQVPAQDASNLRPST